MSGRRPGHSVGRPPLGRSLLGLGLYGFDDRLADLVEVERALQLQVRLGCPARVHGAKVVGVRPVVDHDQVGRLPSRPRCGAIPHRTTGSPDMCRTADSGVNSPSRPQPTPGSDPARGSATPASDPAAPPSRGSGPTVAAGPGGSDPGPFPYAAARAALPGC